MDEETKKKITEATDLDKLVKELDDLDYVTNDNEFVKVRVLSTGHELSPKLDNVKTYLLGQNYVKKRKLLAFDPTAYLPYIRPYEKNDKFMECKLTCTILPKDPVKIENYMKTQTFKNEVERCESRRENKMKKIQKLKLAKMKAPTKGDADRLAAKAKKGDGKGKDGDAKKVVKAKAKAKGAAKKREKKKIVPEDGVVEIITDESKKVQERAVQKKTKAQVSQEKNVLAKRVKRRVKNYKVGSSKTTNSAKTEGAPTEGAAAAPVAAA